MSQFRTEQIVSVERIKGQQRPRRRAGSCSNTKRQTLARTATTTTTTATTIRRLDFFSIFANVR